MTQKIPNNLYILEFANNHMGDINHGIKLIQNFSKICKKYPFNFYRPSICLLSTFKIIKVIKQLWFGC